jgi:uncharacterized protein (TIRG00374 family)
VADVERGNLDQVDAVGQPSTPESRPSQEGDGRRGRRAKRRRRSRWGRPLKSVGTFLALAWLIEYVVFPQLAGARKTLHLLGHVNVALLALVFIMEAAALVAYAALTSWLLPHESRPPLTRVLRINLATLAVSHVVPGGSAAAGAVGFDLLGDAGVDGADAGFALATQALGSAVVLNVLLWLGLVVSIPARGFNPLYGTAALVGAVLLGIFAAAVGLLTRGEQRAARLLCVIATHVPLLDPGLVERAVHRIAARLRTVAADRPLLYRAVGWAAVNWLADAAALWISLAAFGYRIGPDGLIVAYGLANVTAAIPITPGGLGVMEAVLTGALVGFGAPRGIAILGVVTWRLVNFWLPIPVGAASYLSLRLGRQASGGQRLQELRRFIAQAMTRAEDVGRWALRHGFHVDPRRTPPAPSA